MAIARRGAVVGLGAAPALGTDVVGVLSVSGGPSASEGYPTIAWGGASFAAALAADNLIGEYRLAVQPVAVGSGESLFGRLPAPQYLSLVEATPFACGVVVHIYAPQHGPVATWASAGGTAEEG